MIEPLSIHDPVRVGAYVLLGRLGTGAMGRVYLGRSAAGRLVAVKTIRPEFAEEDDFRTRFAYEVAAARRVSGAFTAAVVNAEPEADAPWLATAYVAAPSLEELVRACGPLPVQAVRWLAAGCAEALESIHQANLVHRDLKPSNVLVSLDGPRVIDFGVARAVERVSLTSTRAAVGTPAYMAPEQARDNGRVTGAADIFSLGSTLLFAATGYPPFRGRSVADVLLQLTSGSPDLSGLPAELMELVTSCLNRDPDKRPGTAELLTALSSGVGGHEFALAPLPQEALAVIEDYRRSVQPRLATMALDNDDTFESGAYKAYEGGHQDKEATAAEDTGTTDPGRLDTASREGSSPRTRPSTPLPHISRRTALTVASAAGAIAVLGGAVAAGWAMGAGDDQVAAKTGPSPTPTSTPSTDQQGSVRDPGGPMGPPPALRPGRPAHR